MNSFYLKINTVKTKEVGGGWEWIEPCYFVEAM